MRRGYFALLLLSDVRHSQIANSQKKRRSPVGGRKKIPYNFTAAYSLVSPKARDSNSSDCGKCAAKYIQSCPPG